MKAKIIIFVKVLFSILLLISCENKSIDENSIKKIELLNFYTESKSTIKDIFLQNWSQENKGINNPLFRIQEEETNKSSIDLHIQKLQESIEYLMKKYDNTEIENSIYYKGKPDLNSEEFLTYVRNNGTNRYYELVLSQFYGDTTLISVEEVLNDNELLSSEKISLLLFISTEIATIEAKAYEETISRISNRQTSPLMTNDCLSVYKSERTKCGVAYVASCTVSFIGGFGIGTVAGIAVAAYFLDDCLDDALARYKDC